MDAHLVKIAATKKSLARRAFGIALGIATHGASKVVELGLNVKRIKKRQKLINEFKQLSFKASEAYYCHGKEHGFVGLYRPKRTMAEPEWETVRGAILFNALGAAAKHAVHVDLTVDVTVELSWEVIVENCSEELLVSAAFEVGMEAVVELGVDLAF